jgi:hypothetical protein
MVATIRSRTAFGAGATVTRGTAHVTFSTVSQTPVASRATFLSRRGGGFGGVCHLALKASDAACRIEHFEQTLVDDVRPSAGGFGPEIAQVVSRGKDVGALPGLKAHDDRYYRRLQNGSPVDADQAVFAG